MSTSHDPDEAVIRAAPSIETDDRLSAGQALLVIGVLSALCWAVVVGAGVAISAAF